MDKAVFKSKVKIPLFVVYVAILLVLFELIASATDEISVHIHSSDHACVGEEMLFSVDIHGASHIKSIAVVPVYEAEWFELMGGEWVIDGELADFSVETGDAVIAFATVKDVNGAALQFTLKPSASAVGKSAAVSCKVVIIDEHSHKTEVQAEDLTVTVDCHHILSLDGSKCVKCGSSFGETEEHGHSHGDESTESDAEEADQKDGVLKIILISLGAVLLLSGSAFIYKKKK